MIAKAVYSKFLFGLIFLLFITSCSKTTGEVYFSETYNGKSTAGGGCRAVQITNNRIYAAGQHGQIAIHRLRNCRLITEKNEVVPGIEDFRDLFCKSDNSGCIYMNSGKDAIIYHRDGNGNFDKVFDKPNVFLDGMSFWDDRHGIVFGDPVDGKFFIASTDDGGKSWDELNGPEAIENEAGFAASGTSIQTLRDSIVYIGTGMGSESHVFRSFDRGKNWKTLQTPIRSGDDGFGIYSMCFWNDSTGLIIGGSYLDSTYNKKICYFTDDYGESWSNRSKGLPGYMSCVQSSQDGNVIVATGRLGTYYSINQGKSWDWLTNEPYYTCNISNNSIVLTGKNGVLAFYQFDYQQIVE